MTRKEYVRIMKQELFKGVNHSFINKIRIKYFQPNTNCIYLSRKMWYLFSRNRFGKLRAKAIYLKIIKKYGCCIYPNAIVGEGFFIAHPVGIVLGKYVVGNNFSIFPGCTVGVKRYGEESLGLIPHIGNNVVLYSNSTIYGNIHICDNVTIEANSIVLKSIDIAGTYVGNPAKDIKQL